MPKLLQEYQPQVGDMRSWGSGDGMMSQEVYTGETWVRLADVQAGYEISAVHDGMICLGRRDLVAYWRAGAERAPAWWTCAETENNRGLSYPLFGLGELVWLRSDPAGKAHVISGVSLIPAFEDHPSPQSEDEDLSTPQSWMYQFVDGGSEDEDNLLKRADLAFALQKRPVLTPAGVIGDDFDPFLDDLPEVGKGQNDDAK